MSSGGPIRNLPSTLKASTHTLTLQAAKDEREVTYGGMDESNPALWGCFGGAGGGWCGGAAGAIEGQNLFVQHQVA